MPKQTLLTKKEQQTKVSRALPAQPRSKWEFKVARQAVDLNCEDIQAFITTVRKISKKVTTASTTIQSSHTQTLQMTKKLVSHTHNRLVNSITTHNNCAYHRTVAILTLLFIYHPALHALLIHKPW